MSDNNQDLYKQLNSQHATLNKLLDNFNSLQDLGFTGADLASLMLLSVEVSGKLAEYAYECPNCHEVKRSEVTYQGRVINPSVTVSNIYSCNHCGNNVAPLQDSSTN